MKKLNEATISQKLRSIEKWELKDGKWIERRYRFKDYLEGIRFVNKLAERSEEVNHHPFITIQYKLIIVELTSWHEKGLTDVDFDLADEFDCIFEGTDGSEGSH
ncbi:4a-hydroxytetrahydrobiopterin dehydratase [Rossellomorea sp. NPDC077527]|uniref:4a-hydroxytetrahydrobiopterin dehydratase n=1 Tax=Rossellomorea sp. NPDC077527 TaxID=3364510 RepID=UPI0037C72726